MKIRVLMLIATLGLSACQNMPEPYAPPVQRQPFDDPNEYTIDRVLNMSDADASAHFIRDIAPRIEHDWRWAGRRPALHVFMRANEHVRFVADFAFPEATFHDTGPVTLSFYVNGNLLDSVHYATVGVKHFEKPVPAEWIPVGRESTVAAEIDKVWISKDDRTEYGFILTRIGLTQRALNQPGLTQHGLTQRGLTQQ